MPTPTDSKEFMDFQQWREDSKKQVLNVSNCISSWTDICGFGDLLENNNWNLNKLQDAGVVILLNEVYTVAGRPLLINPDPLPNDKIIVLNDGVARTIDLTHKDKLDSYIFLMFLRDLVFTHYFLLETTKRYKVGVRTILAGGERIQYSPISTTGHSILSYDKEKISNFGKQLLNTTFVYNPAEFQMNTAFAKAFTIDSLGTKKNIKINGFYIEDDFIKQIEGLNDIEIIIGINEINFFYKKSLVFELHISESFKHNIKGLEVLIHHIDKFIIHKEFDGDDVEIALFR